MVSHQRCHRQSANLKLKFVGPYLVVEALRNPTHKAEQSGQFPVQNKAHLKPYWASLNVPGEALPLLKPSRQPAAWSQVRRDLEYKIIILRLVVRARAPNCPPQHTDESVTRPGSPLPSPEIEPTPVIATPFLDVGSSNSDEEGIPVDPCPDDPFFGGRSPKDRATIGLSEKPTPAATAALLTGLCM